MLKLHGLDSQRIFFRYYFHSNGSLTLTLTHARLLADMASNVLTDHKNLLTDMCEGFVQKEESNRNGN